MSEQKSLLVWLRDPSLSAHATSVVPAWLWSADASRILWANPTAAVIFNAASPAAISGHTIDPKGSAALQIARLAASLPHGSAPRLERLRGFGGRFGRALMCSCTRVILSDGTPAILIVATEPTGSGLALPEQAKRLLANVKEAAGLFTPNGKLLHATPAAEAIIGRTTMLGAIGASVFAGEALASGHATGDTAVGSMTFDKIGHDASTLLLVEFKQPEQAATAPEAIAQPEAPVVAPPPAPEPPAPVVMQEPEPPVPPPAVEQPQPAATQANTPAPAPAPTIERRQPLRFVWQLDAENHFTLGTPEFVTLLGPRTASVLGKTWHDISMALGLDPENQVAHAFATRDTWSGITVTFPVDDSNERLPAELSGLPVFDRDRNFRGYRGFGVCRDVARITELQARRAKAQPPAPVTPRAEPPVFREEPRPALSIVPPSVNVVPFRSSTPAEKPPTLTPVERKAFRDLASRLTARLRGAETGDVSDVEDILQPLEPAPPSAPEQTPQPISRQVPEAPRSVETTQDQRQDQRPILDRLPVGVLVYRLDKLIYANRAFLDWTGYESIHALADAGGLDALFVEPSSDTPHENNGAKALTIATNKGEQLPVEARLFTSPWEGESALVLMLASVNGQAISSQPAAAPQAKVAEAALESAKAEAEELRSILDTAADGIVVIDREGRVLSLNASAEALFGHQNRELLGVPFAGLFAPESQRSAHEYLTGVLQDDFGSENEGREVKGRASRGGTIPLFMTIGKISDGTDRLCAIFRNITPWKNAENELLNAKHLAEKASSAKSDFLAKISHEIRTPLNAIIGFSEVMMEERFGPVGNERYKQYLKDIHTSGGHLVSLLNDLLDLSKIEAGKLDLDFAAVDLNELTQQCVALMQPQANRERIIIRTSLAASLQPVLADARSVRQIVLNLLSNSIKSRARSVGPVGGQSGRPDQREARRAGWGMARSRVSPCCSW